MCLFFGDPPLPGGKKQVVVLVLSPQNSQTRYPPNERQLPGRKARSPRPHLRPPSSSRRRLGENVSIEGAQLQKRSGADFSAAKQHSVNTGGLMAHPSRRHGPNGLNSFSAQGAREKKHWKSQSSHPPQRWISIRESACERWKGAYQVTQVSHFDWHSAYCGRPCFKERRETQHHVTTSTVPRQPSKLAATNGPMKKQH